MESEPFWTDLKSRFLTLSNQVGEIQIYYEDISLRGLAAAYGQCVADELRGVGTTPPN